MDQWNEVISAMDTIRRSMPLFWATLPKSHWEAITRRFESLEFLIDKAVKKAA